MITASEVITRPDLLGPAFAGASWDRWRAVLRAAEGLPLDRQQHRLFRAVAGRHPPRRRVRELWAVVGRRGGKDSIASAIATAAAMGDYRQLLRPGERATVMCLACDRAQARIVHRYIAGYFSANPLLTPLIERETEETLELGNDVEVVVTTNSFRAVRGRTIVCSIFDEVAYWRDDTSSTPDFETYNAVAPGLTTLPGSMLVGISTPYRRSGLLFDRWRRYYGKDDPAILVIQGPSTAFNPTLSPAIIDQALERDPEAASSEWLGQWRSDLADFISREAVETAVVSGRYELPPIAGVKYAAFVDPSGGSSDSMTLAIGHAECGRAILDAVREARPPFSPAAVVSEFAMMLGLYGVATVSGDRYAGQWPVERFNEHGVRYLASDRPKNEIYLDFLPLLNSGRVELLDNARLIAQLCALERRTARGGRDSIDHAPGAHDDIANAAAGVLTGLVGRPRFPSLGVYEWTRQRAEALGASSVPALGEIVQLPTRCAHGAILGRCRQCLVASGDMTTTGLGGLGN